MPWRDFLARLDIRWLAVAASGLFSLFAVLSDPLPNRDAYGYLRAAELFASEGIRPILDTYGWYGYSVLIALADPLLPGGLLHAAHLLNAIAYGILVFAFITLVREYRDNRATALFAALVILCFPLINEMRHYMVRDFGFWAFCLLALLQLVRYQHNRRPRHALGWCLAILAATLFRLEGLVLLALAPLSLLVNPSLAAGGRLRSYLLVQAMLLAGGGLIYLCAASAGIDLLDLIRYAWRYYLPRLYDITALVESTADQLNGVIFAPQNFPGDSSHGVVILVFSYLYTLAVNLVHALGVPYALLLLYGFRARMFLTTPHAWLPAWFFIGGSLVSLLIFMFIMHFLTQRYAALASLVLISFLPLCLDQLQVRARDRGRLAAFRAAAGLLFFYLAVDSLVSFGYSKSHLEEAVAWTRTNLGPDDELVANDHALAYFSGRIEDYDSISLNPREAFGLAESGDYLALSVDHDDASTREFLARQERLRELASFANERDDRVFIYRVGPAL